MAKAKDTIARRRGISSRYWFGSTREISYGTWRDRSGKAHLTIDFTIPSKGGGATFISVQIGANDFTTLAKNMGEVDSQKAMEAMSRELSKQITAIRKLRN